MFMFSWCAVVCTLESFTMDWIWLVVIVLIIVIAEKMVEMKILPLKVHFEYLTSTIRNHHREILVLNTRLNTKLSPLRGQQGVTPNLQTELNKIFSTLGNQQEVISRLQIQLELKNSTLRTMLETQMSTFEIKLENKISDLKAHTQPMRADSQDRLETQVSALSNTLENKAREFQFQLDNVRSNYLDQLETHRAALESKMSNFETQMENLRSAASHDQFDCKIATLENELDEENSELECKLQTTSATSQNQVESHVSSLRKLMENKTCHLQDQLEKIRIQSQSDLATQISILDQKLENRCSDLDAQMDAMRSTCLKAETQIASLQKSLDTTTLEFQKQLTDAAPVVAFTARVTEDLKMLKKGQVVPFQDVVTNIKEAFNPDTGIFICPITGLNHFSCTILSMDDRLVNTGLCVSGIWALATCSCGTTKNSSSASGALDLKAGEDVCIKIGPKDDTNIRRQYSSFSGHLIRKM